MATRLIATLAALAISSMLSTVKVAMALPLGCMRKVLAEPALGEIVGDGGEKEERRARLLGVLAHGEGDQLENGPISATTPWSMRRGASDLPSSTLFCVSPGSSVSLAPPRDLIPPRVDLVHRQQDPVQRELGSKASGPVTGRM
jgi:hypothetical protein